ncbi:MAG: hypothetical protein QG633_16 [Patescibacteria group bacterium]|jgi:hypothetical protein|nr:hypothetical protein [Patescibacteria group bacterium]
MRRGHVVELLVVLALGMFAVSANAQPDTLGMCPDGEAAQHVEDGMFLVLRNQVDQDWRANWQTFRAANPHIDFGTKRIISYTPDDTRIPFYVRELLCGLSKAGYELQPATIFEKEKIDRLDDPTSDSWLWWVLLAGIVVGVAMAINGLWTLFEL